MSAPERKTPQGFLAKYNRLEGVDWVNYEKWVEKLEKAGLKDLPLTAPLISSPVRGTEAGIYGADRWVFPDLPCYYEYRLRATANAGRQSITSEPTAWVRPLVRSHPQVLPDSTKVNELPIRQAPRIESVHAVERLEPTGTPATPETIKLKIALVISTLRDLLPPELRHLWIESDEDWKAPGVEQEFKLGSLPNLEMEYQLYFRVDPIRQEEFEKSEPALEQVLKPLARVSFSQDESKPKVDSQITNVAMDIKMAQISEGEFNGRLTLEIEFDVSTNPELKNAVSNLTELLASFQSDQHGFRRLLAVQGWYRGASSRLMEFFEKQVSGEPQ